MLWHVVNRVKASKLVNKVVIATDTNSPMIVEFARRNGIPIYEGSENDILDRLYQAAKFFNIDPIVRVWGDCPLVNSQIIDNLIRFFNNGYAYTKGYPEGQNVAIVDFKTLEKAWNEIKDPKDREWIHTYLSKQGDILESEYDLSSIKLSVDTYEDLDRIRGLIERSKVISRL
jgi:spore coat polysaccharide biosynthesis protein SpsF (cytidylyltransferase family)